MANIFEDLAAAFGADKVGELTQAQIAVISSAANNRIMRMLALEYGIVDCDAVPHRPDRLPFVRPYDVPLNETLEVNVEAFLGKSANRGHVVNIGDGNMSLHFGYDQAMSGEYILQPGAALDTSSWLYDLLQARSIDTAGRIQVFAQ